MRNLIVLLALFIVVSVCLPAWDYTPPRPAKDIAATVVVLPDSVYREFGFSDRTTVYGNLNRILLALQVTQSEVLALKESVKVLESQVRALIENKVNEVTDPNEVSKQRRNITRFNEGTLPPIPSHPDGLEKARERIRRRKSNEVAK